MHVSTTAIRCFSNATLGFGHEQLFREASSAQLWRRRSYVSVAPPLVFALDAGLDETRWRSSAVVLERSSHELRSRTRTIVNAPDVIELLRGPHAHVKHLFITGGLSARHQQMAALANHALIVSPHSSFLKGLVFARPGTVVIELQPAWTFGMEFHAGTDVLGVQHFVSSGHRPVKNNGTDLQRCGPDINWRAANESNGLKRDEFGVLVWRNYTFKHCDIAVVISKLQRELNALRKL